MGAIKGKKTDVWRGSSYCLTKVALCSDYVRSNSHLKTRKAAAELWISVEEMVVVGSMYLCLLYAENDFVMWITSRVAVGRFNSH